MQLFFTTPTESMFIEPGPLMGIGNMTVDKKCKWFLPLGSFGSSLGEDMV